MISFFQKLTNLFRNRSSKNPHQDNDSYNYNKFEALSERINHKEKIIAEKEVRLNEAFNKLKKYREFLINLKAVDEIKRTEFEKKVNSFNQDILKKNDKMIELKLKVYDFEKQIETLKQELQKKEQRINQFLDENNKDILLSQSDFDEKEILKKTIRDLVAENKKLKNSLSESPVKEEDLLTLLELKNLEIPDFNQTSKTSDSSQKEANDKQLNNITELITEIEDEILTSQKFSVKKTPEEDFENVNKNVDTKIRNQTEQLSLNIPKVSEDKISRRRTNTLAPENRIVTHRREENLESNTTYNQYHKSVELKPKIVCWKDERIWKVGLEIPDELIDDSELIIFQKDISLSKDIKRDNTFNLKSISGGIHLQGPSNNYPEVDFRSNDYLIFKMNSDNLNDGILVNSTSIGNYLAIVPSQWKFNDSISGSQISEKEGTIFQNYNAYYFFLDKNSSFQKIGFTDQLDRNIIIDSTKEFYSLNGNFVEDYSERYGPLFIERLPIIRLFDNHLWAKLDCIIVGEEGEGRDNLRKKIKISADQSIIQLSDELPDIISGWYFLRFYDKNLRLVDSCDFRFISTILMIKYSNSNPVPDENGHTESNIEIIHTNDLNLELKSDSQEGVEIINQDSEHTKIIIKPLPSIEKLKFVALSRGGRDVSLYFPIIRFWWTVNHNGFTNIWNDKIMDLYPKDFLSLTKSLFIKLPSRGWSNSLKFGFQNSELRTFPIKLDQSIIQIPLKEYSDSDYYINNLGTYPLICEVSRNDIKYIFTPFRLLVNIQCKYCHEFQTYSLNDLFSHILEKHFDYFYKEPNYEDIQKLMPELPVRIYECVHCPPNNPTYVKAYSRNPVEEIIRHIEDEHPGESHTFRVKNNVKEIEKILAIEIPSYKKCNLCNYNSLVLESDLKIHLRREHKKDILKA